MVYETDATTWTMAQAQSICRAFLPPQSSYQRQTKTSEGDPEDVYASPLLVHTFASTSSWYDPSGTAALTYVIRAGGVFQCDLAVYA
jgi:hypothetical protein